MRKGLWEISQRFTCGRLDLFPEKIEVVCVTERGLEDFVCFVCFSATGQKIHFPETAHGKCAFITMFALLLRVNEAGGAHESFPNPCIGFLHPFGASRLETVVRKEQRRCINDVAAACLRVANKLRVPGTLLDLLPNVLSLGRASGSIETPNLTARVHLQQSIERHPTHQP